MVDIKLYAAPMEGLTTCWWRQAHRVLFGGADKYFTPFLSPNANLCFQQKELDEIQGEADTVPQLLTNRGDHFLWAARELYRRGYREVNFNLGCPSGTVTAKRKGAGLLAYPEELERCLGEIFDGLPEMRVSVKTRIGKNDPAEWEALLALYEKYPISELIVHPLPLCIHSIFAEHAKQRLADVKPFADMFYFFLVQIRDVLPLQPFCVAIPDGGHLRAVIIGIQMKTLLPPPHQLISKVQHGLQVQPCVALEQTMVIALALQIPTDTAGQNVPAGILIPLLLPFLNEHAYLFLPIFFWLPHAFHMDVLDMPFRNGIMFLRTT